MATAASDGTIKKITVIVIAFLAISSAYLYVTDKGWEEKWAKRDAADFKASQEAQRYQMELEQANREKERQNAAQVASLENRLSMETRNHEKVKADLMAQYDNGNKRLRKQFQCAASEAGKAIQNGSAGAGSDAASKCGLSRSDVENLIRLAQQANDISSRLTTAQLELCSVYEAVNGEKLNYEVCSNEEAKQGKRR